MKVNLEEMSYQDFKKWCNDRACDGRWDMLEAMACLHLIREIDSIKVKGLFQKKSYNESQRRSMEKV